MRIEIPSNPKSISVVVAHFQKLPSIGNIVLVSNTAIINYSELVKQSSEDPILIALLILPIFSRRRSPVA